MNSKKNNTWAARAAALGLSVAIAGGAALVAAAPAQAAPATVKVTQSDIRSNEDSYPGWHQGYDDAADRARVGVNGLELFNQSQIIDGFTPEQYISGDTLADVVATGSWTTTTGPSYFQLPFLYNGGQSSQSFTTLRPASPSTGAAAVSLDDVWATSSAIKDADGAVVYEKDATATLREFLNTLDSAQLIGFGVLTDGVYDPSAVYPTAYIESIAFNGTTYTFGTTGAATVSGTAAIGSTLTVSTADFPQGSTFSYEWYWNGGQRGGPIDGATGTSYTVTDDVAGSVVGVLVTAKLAGFTTARVYSNLTDVVPFVQKPAAAAPVANSTDLPAYLASHGVTPGTPLSAGLPATLDPTKGYTASVEWTANDGFVDVYLYSTPILLGSFPVVDGKVQVTLSADVLAKLAAGSHTLVLVGQSSGGVQAVALSVAAVTGTAALAATGDNNVIPATLAGLLVLLGAAGVLVSRRRRATQA
ncbi:LPXTG cell wall anchor domain-containing protein [Leifsonia aquatica]|uniref:LPXTG-motif protein cell wall anchor domain protein n=2 Tax=Leifsonia aquatica TaxID=144185 RepID=U2RGB1_LEIAQ|nr:LPXTG cell wall anchor domain-containing protein [Leifsonia aquatica]ERK67599.1 LPXTG-motif protein cell wall anchor domain protein [Leifsonia aquatica ATCC 14665]MBB2967192.1 LPXTG-motif cell wall-anchored protein [Leifsonia aquatica]